MKIEDKILLALSSIFCTIIVTGNLIFQKFIVLNLYFHSFEISVGVLLYPITFLVMDLITEFYGKNTANYVIKVGIFVSLMLMLLIFVADLCSATIWSPVDNATFNRVFSVYGIGAMASLVANFMAQTLDVAIFSKLKEITNSKHLWLRNNVSTILGQLIDTLCVVSILCFYNIIPFDKFNIIVINSFLFKTICALIDTPFCYFFHHILNNIIPKNTKAFATENTVQA